MRVVIAGGSGLIGRALAASLKRDGFEVTLLGRRARPGVEAWDPEDPTSAADRVRGADAVVNLCGAAVGPRPWTPGRRREIRRSRVGPTATLVAAIERLSPSERPRLLINASGTDGYTDLDAEAAGEATDTSRTEGFLARVGEEWEAAAFRAESLGVRVVAIRTAFVLAAGSPLLQLFALPTRLGLGGPIGGGRQWFSWIHIDDIVRTYRLAIDDERLRGVVNAASPNPVRQRDVARAMGAVLHRPAFFPVPAWPLRLVLREQSTLILGSRRVLPAKLQELDMPFEFPTLEAALRDTL